MEAVLIALSPSIVSELSQLHSPLQPSVFLYLAICSIPVLPIPIDAHLKINVGQLKTSSVLNPNPP